MTDHTGWSRLGHVLAPPLSPVRGGFLNITRHTLALLGLSVVCLVLVLAARPDLLTKANHNVMVWLEKRQFTPGLDSSSLAEQSPALRSTATLVNDLSDEKQAVTQWLSRKYKISPEPLGALVSEAWRIGERSQIDPTLILSIVAIESRFNPFASGSKGALGLMQVEPEAHADVFSRLGGRLAAFDPLTNLRVGTRLLQSMLMESSNLEEALHSYGAASGQTNQALYARRVLAEHQRLETISQAANSDVSPVNKTDLAPPNAEKF